MTLQVTCPKCGRKITVLQQFVGRQIHCSFCRTLISVAAPKPRPASDFASLPQASPAESSPAPRRPQRSQPRPDRSNVPIVVATIFICTAAIIAFAVVVALQLGIGGGRTFALQSEPENGLAVASQESPEDSPPRTRIAIAEGYTFEMPRGFFPLARLQKEQGEVCYTFGSEEDAAAGCVLCVSPDRNSTRDSKPPVIYSSASASLDAPVAEINGTYYLEKNRTLMIRVDDMSALTYRIEFNSGLGRRKMSTIGWFLHAMDDGQVVTIRIITSADISVRPPKGWYSSITSLRREPSPEASQIPEEFRVRGAG